MQRALLATCIAYLPAYNLLSKIWAVIGVGVAIAIAIAIALAIAVVVTVAAVAVLFKRLRNEIQTDSLSDRWEFVC